MHCPGQRADTYRRGILDGNCRPGEGRHRIGTAGLPLCGGEHRRRLDSGAKRVTIHLPYDKGGILDQLYQEAKVEQVEYAETIDVVAVCTPKTIGQLGPLVEGWQPHKEPWED